MLTAFHGTVGELQNAAKFSTLSGSPVSDLAITDVVIKEIYLMLISGVSKQRGSGWLFFLFEGLVRTLHISINEHVSTVLWGTGGHGPAAGSVQGETMPDAPMPRMPRMSCVRYLQLPGQCACVAGFPQSRLQGVGDHVAHAGLGGLLLLGRLDLQQQRAAHRGRNQLRVHKQEHSGGENGMRCRTDTPKALQAPTQLIQHL